MHHVETITRDELKAVLDAGAPVQVVMALTRWAFDRLHISGSQALESWMETIGRYDQDQEVVVYCTNPNCPASLRAYYFLQMLGFERVRRFAGGIEEWMEAGYPVEGSLVEERQYAAA